jgi:hypothetical protein
MPGYARQKLLTKALIKHPLMVGVDWSCLATGLDMPQKSASKLGCNWEVQNPAVAFNATIE